MNSEEQLLPVTPLGDGVRLDLPRRQLGTARGVGFILMLVGLLALGFAVVWVAVSLRGGGSGIFWLFNAIFSAAALVPAAIGMVALSTGLAIVLGRCSVEITRDRLRLIERAGPFHWSWSRPVAELRRLIISTDAVKVDSKPVSSGPLAQAATIVAEFHHAPRLLIGVGYPRPLLRGLATQIARQVDNLRPDRLLVADDRPLIVEAPVAESPPPPVEKLLPQPADSPCLVQRQEQGLTIQVPPRGFWKGSAGLGCFSVVWLSILSVITVAMIVQYVSQGALVQESGKPIPLWGGLLFVSIFWAAGGFMFLSSLHMARRRAILDVVGDTLLITEAGLLGTKQREWRRADLQDIRMGNSSVEVNERPLKQLQIHPRQGKMAHLLTGRNTEELRWMASELRHALGLVGDDGG